MNYYEITKKLIGPINPVGCCQRDAERYDNLSDLIILVGLLLNDINHVSLDADSPEASVSKAGQMAKSFKIQIGKTCGDTK